MPKILTYLQRDVIAYILALNEERDPPMNDATHFMRAFDEGFNPDMKFTLHTPMLNKLILYELQKRLVNAY